MSASAPKISLPNGWEPRGYQLPLWRHMHREGDGKRALVIWPRRHGKDDVALHYTACAMMERVGVYWHLLPQQNQARKAIWNAVNPRTGRRRIDDAFPRDIREATRDDEMFIRFKNGSTWQAIGSDNYDALVGTPPIGVVFSEWALSNPQAWSLIRPILLENGGWAMFITTPRGRNHAYRMAQMAEASTDWFYEHLTADTTGVFTPEQLEREKAELMSERGQEDGEAIFEQEYHCSWAAALPGAYYGKIMDRLDKAGAICRVPYNPAVPVHTAWDLGANDTTPIWFMQRTPVGWAAIDYLASSGVGVDWYVREILAKPYVYGEHLLPHDGGHKRLNAIGAATIKQTCLDLGLKRVRVVDRTQSVANDINEVRKVLPTCVFDKEKCEHGIEALKNYRREWDEKLKAYRDHPLHDWASDPADAFRTFVMGKPQDTERAPVRAAAVPSMATAFNRGGAGVPATRTAFNRR
jgi:phage terminase large subunit